VPFGGWHDRAAVPTRVIPLLLLALPLAARALCTSDDVPQPQAVLERFINADCAECWGDPKTPRPAANTIALDWVVPGRKAEDAPLSAVALDEAVERLASLRRPVPDRGAVVTSLRAGERATLRLAQGDAFNDYVGTTIELKAPGRGPWHAWLLLVENLPEGTEGSPVPRTLVRNVFRPDWGKANPRAAARLIEARAMQIHEGAKPERLRLVAVPQDARGRIRAISRTECP
jgi:hypothetical protein